METAIIREKRIKRWPRAWKYELIQALNPTWRDLAEDFGFEPLAERQADAGAHSRAAPSLAEKLAVTANIREHSRPSPPAA